MQDFFLQFVSNQSSPAFRADLERKTKIVRVLASMFLSNYKMFVLAPVLSHAAVATNKYLLDMIEGMGNAGTLLEAAPPIPKKEARFVYFSVFMSYPRHARSCRKSQSSKLVVRRGKPDRTRLTLDKTAFSDEDFVSSICANMLR